MTDRELLERAARAAGYGIQFSTDGRAFISGLPGIGWKEWNPLEDVDDALRLLIRMYLEVRQVHGKAHVGIQGRFWKTEVWFPDGDIYAATRRAVVRAAAAMAKEA